MPPVTKTPWPAKQPPPMTTAKQDMIDMSLPAPARRLIALFEEGPFAGRQLVTVREVLQHAKVVEGIYYVTERHAVDALKSLGYDASAKKICFADKPPVRVWGRPGTPIDEASFNHAQVVMAYKQDMKKGGKA